MIPMNPPPCIKKRVDDFKCTISYALINRLVLKHFKLTIGNV